MSTATVARPVRLESKPLSLQRANGLRPRLLLAEDSDPIRIVTSAMLKNMGCDVEAVIHGEEAVNCASASSFDVIVLDIEMPVMDGITAARSIRGMGGAVSATPIMALSAFLADAMQSASWSDMFDIALPKPANRNELHAAVQAALAWQPKTTHRTAAVEAIPLISTTLMADLNLGLTTFALKELLAVACRDIDVCTSQLSHLDSLDLTGSDRVYAQKLNALGRTFAAPRLAAAADAFARSAHGTDRRMLLENLKAVAEATSAALRLA